MKINFRDGEKGGETFRFHIKCARTRAREAYIGAGFGVAASMPPDDFSKPADVSQPRAEEKKMPAEGRGQSMLVPLIKQRAFL